MRIVYDNIIFTWQQSGGISVVWGHLLKRMLKTSFNVTCIEYSGTERNITRKTLNIPSKLIDKRSNFAFKIRRYLNPIIKIKEPFIFHSSYFRTSHNKQAINVTTVHDFTYELFETNLLKKLLHCWQKHRAIRHSDCIVCVSYNTRNDLLRFLPDVDPAKIHVIYNGVDEAFRPLPDIQKKNYVLFVGQRKGYKNFESILHPLAKANLPLVIVGKPLTEKEKKKLVAVGIKYHYIGTISNQELNKRYNEALCLLYPSSYEGFGLPVIEAQRAGCPVIAKEGSSITEIIGDTRLLLHHVSKEEILAKLLLLKESKLYQDFVDKGLQNSQKYTWDLMTKGYLKLYESICKFNLENNLI